MKKVRRMREADGSLLIHSGEERNPVVIVLKMEAYTMPPQSHWD
jgi:hypothetical protein